MLEFYFSYRGVLKRLCSGALGGEMDRLAEHFFALGYKRKRLAEGVRLEVPGHKRLDFRDRPALSNGERPVSCFC